MKGSDVKLVEIWNSAKAWGVLSTLKKNPKLAYRLHKYEKKVNAEMEACNKQRDAIMYECAGVTPPTPPDTLIVQISAKIEGPDKTEIDNPQFIAFVKKFNEALNVESDLEWIGISMDDLIEGLGAETANVISEQDIELLEPFFTEKPKTDLKLVGKP